VPGKDRNAVTAPLSVNHQDQFPSVTSASTWHPVLAQRRGGGHHRPRRRDRHATSVTGTYRATRTSSPSRLRGQPWLILAALITIYIVLGVLYESFVHPFTILTTLRPLASAHCWLSCCAHGSFHDRAHRIVRLMASSSKNAIMMIDFALEAERAQGLSRARPSSGELLRSGRS